MEQKVIIFTRTSSGIGYETADGRNDVLVDNVGYGSYGAVEDVSMEEACYLIRMGAKPLVFMHSILPTRWFDRIMMHAS
jgi:hypothetical protein